MLWSVAAHPVETLIRQWNWKSAVLSAAWRATIFFTVNLSAGWPAATAAAATELVFRFATSGFYGALTAALRRAEPMRHAVCAAMVLLPLVAHSLEGLVHWSRGTAHLGASMAASVIFTALSTSFNVFAMRRGALIVGNGSQSLLQDLRRMPSLVALFLKEMAKPTAWLIRRMAPWRS